MTTINPIDPELRRDQYLYHSTQQDNIQSILQNGIQPSTDSHRDRLEDDLATIAADNEIALPVTRQDCVFFYATPDRAARLTSFETDDSEMDSLQQTEGIVIINGELITGPVYVGEFKLISDAIDHQYMSEPDDAMISESYTAALRRYATSLTRIESLTGLENVCNDFHLPEVIVENGVSPSTVVDTVL